MAIIEIKDLRMLYKVKKKETGLKGSIKNLFSSDYTTIEAVKGINFKIEVGDFVGLVGPNGAGKTTILKILSGILVPTSGTVDVMGFTPWEHKNEFKKNFSIVMGQRSQLWWDLPAKETFYINRDIYEIPEARFKGRLELLSNLLNVESKMDVQVRRLSLGERMKMELIAAFLHFPKVIFMDEPTIGLDVLSQRIIREFLMKINKQDKVTVILTSHYMADIVETCEKILIINNGGMVYNGHIQDIFKDYGSLKTITFSFTNSVVRENIENIGNVISFEKNIVKFKVSNKDVPVICQKVLNQFTVEDIKIDETSMEDIICDFFSDK